MNKERILELAHFMEKSLLKFNMATTQSYYVLDESCGTAGCIAGHAAILWRPVRIDAARFGYNVIYHRCDIKSLQNLLGLNNEVFDSLIMPTLLNDGVSYATGGINKAWAIRTLRHLVDTGKVDWLATMEE